MSSYKADLGGAAVTLYGAASFVGAYWSDLGNTVSLPGYTKLDLGIEAELDSGMFFRISAGNLNNRHRLTEGDPRGSGSNNGRPIFGRSFTFSIGNDFELCRFSPPCLDLNRIRFWLTRFASTMENRRQSVFATRAGLLRSLRGQTNLTVIRSQISVPHACST